MSMFDLGKRGSGNSGQDHDDEFMRELDTPGAGVAPQTPSGTARRHDAAVIGPSIHIDGTLRGEEDLIIEGQVSGTVQLHDNSLTIGSKGRVKADIYAHTIYVEGTVEGDLFGSERVSIKKTADIRGNVTAPRVALEDGARFKGAIEMDAQAVEAAMGTTKSRSGNATARSGAPVAETSTPAGKPSTGAQTGSSASSASSSGGGDAAKAAASKPGGA